METIMDNVVPFLVGASAFSAENQSFWMAVQGAMAVRKGPNKDKKMNWFYAFVQSILVGYSGGLFGFLWLGKPSAMLSNDLNMAACILAFLLVNYTPFDVGFRILDSLPFSIVTVSFAQLFRATGLIRFVRASFDEFKGNPSKYYPIPVFGPILYGTMLGNMGGFFLKGVQGHVGNGMPWPFQNGFFCTSFYHFFVHDKTGPIGVTLRLVIPTSLRFGLEDETFAAALVSLFMQVTGILQMPIFLGPDFSPFSFVGSFFERLSRKEPSLQNKPKPESKQKNSKGRTKNKEKHS